ncbi:MAG TPA: 30S ribosomal protein S16 [Clostridia bacterium]|nr:30S ribosomal protein S16 [Clostridia bacterium]
MAVRIRLRRMGAKKRPFYRFVVADSRSPRDGKFIEEIGYYDPLKNPREVRIEEDKAVEWMLKGARPSETVRRLFAEAGVMKKLDEARGLGR